MNIDIMAMFPDDFPFNRRETEAEVAETQASADAESAAAGDEQAG